jgi:hypothetical protein
MTPRNTQPKPALVKGDTAMTRAFKQAAKTIAPKKKGKK